MLSENEHMKGAVAKELASNVVTAALTNSNEAKVQSRILSSKIIAMEVASVIDALKVTILPELKRVRDGEEGGEGSADGEDGQEEGDDERELLPPHSKKTKVAMVHATGREGSSDEDDGDASSGVKAFSEEKVAADDGWESGSLHGDDIGSDGESDEESGEDENSDEDGVSATRPSTLTKTPQPSGSSKTKATAAVKASGQSTFLPSLAVGFTKGDSDASDFSDGGDEDPAPKKNRRGQRARRA